MLMTVTQSHICEEQGYISLAQWTDIDCPVCPNLHKFDAIMDNNAFNDLDSKGSLLDSFKDAIKKYNSVFYPDNKNIYEQYTEVRPMLKRETSGKGACSSVNECNQQKGSPDKLWDYVPLEARVQRNKEISIWENYLYERCATRTKSSLDTADHLLSTLDIKVSTDVSSYNRKDMDPNHRKFKYFWDRMELYGKLMSSTPFFEDLYIKDWVSTNFIVTDASKIETMKLEVWFETNKYTTKIDISSLESEKAQKGFLRLELKHEISSDESEIASMQADQENSDAQRERENVIYLSKKQDLTQSIAALKSAMMVLSKHMSNIGRRRLVDPFLKVKQIIQDVIQTRMTNAVEVAEQKRLCDGQLAEAEAKLNKWKAFLTPLEPLNEQKERQSITLAADIATLSQEHADNRNAIAQATELRKEESHTFLVNDGYITAIMDATNLHNIEGRGNFCIQNPWYGASQNGHLPHEALDVWKNLMEMGDHAFQLFEFICRTKNKFDKKLEGEFDSKNADPTRSADTIFFADREKKNLGDIFKQNRQKICQTIRVNDDNEIEWVKQYAEQWPGGSILEKPTPAQAHVCFPLLLDYKTVHKGSLVTSVISYISDFYRYIYTQLNLMHKLRKVDGLTSDDENLEKEDLETLYGLFTKPYERDFVSFAAKYESKFKDLEKYKAEADAAETLVKNEYDQFILDSNTAISDREADIEHKTAVKQTVEIDITKIKADIQTYQDLIDSENVHRGELREQCNVFPENYEERVALNQEVIESLQEALLILNDKEPARRRLGGGGHIGAAGTPLGKVYGILEELDTRMENELTDIDIEHDAKKAEFEQVSESRRRKVDTITGTLASNQEKLSETDQKIASNQELLASKESFLASLAEEYAKKPSFCDYMQMAIAYPLERILYWGRILNFLRDQCTQLQCDLLEQCDQMTLELKIRRDPFGVITSIEELNGRRAIEFDFETCDQNFKDLSEAQVFYREMTNH